jgi:ABC-2 type transport system ATP-binding protein
MSPSKNGGSDRNGKVMIEVDHLSRYYGPVPAINNVSFRAEKGEILGFLGPNGAGKTTTMRMLTGYLPPTSGRALIAGHDVVEESLAARSEIGYLPENTPLYPEMTISGYLNFMARLRGVENRNEAVERVMERVSIDHRADDLIGHLSKGFRQRVGIAQALVHDPSVMILDEPTIGLDPKQIREVRSLIHELGGEHTVLISTHILSEAQQICDRVLIIKRGQIVAEDTPAQLTARLSGGERIRVVTNRAAEVAAVRKTLGKAGGVTSVEHEGAGAYLVTADAGTDPRDELARGIIGGGWPLLELVPTKMSLEDVFLELIGADDGESIQIDDPANPDGADSGSNEELEETNDAEADDA